MPSIRIQKATLILLLGLLVPGSAALIARGETPDAVRAERTFVVAPEKKGNGDGIRQETAADFRDERFWSVVERELQTHPVAVDFLDGSYFVSSDSANKMPTLVLSDLGHKDHRLTLQGISKTGVVFTRQASDSLDGSEGPGFLQFTRSQNLLVRNLHFTAKHPIGYATHFCRCQNIVVDGCSWVDLPGVHYGATGTSHSSSAHITFTNCVFKRVGDGGHAHMAYNSYDPKHIRFANCHFEDCAGDYVRFRDGTDFGVVVGCTFKSTGTYKGVNRPFISVPLFNDDNPAKPGSKPNYEYFGTHFLIANNDFNYANDKPEGSRTAVRFHHSGFDPPGRHHLLTSDQARRLAKGTVAEKRKFMLENLGIDGASVHFFNNRFRGVDMKMVYTSSAAYGALSKGWSGGVDITDTVNGSNVEENDEQALRFFDRE